MLSELRSSCPRERSRIPFTMDLLSALGESSWGFYFYSFEQCRRVNLNRTLMFIRCKL